MFGKDKTKKDKEKVPRYEKRRIARQTKGESKFSPDEIVDWAVLIVTKFRTSSKSPGRGASKSHLYVIIISTLTMLGAFILLFCIYK